MISNTVVIALACYLACTCLTSKLVSFLASNKQYMSVVLVVSIRLFKVIDDLLSAVEFCAVLTRKLRRNIKSAYFDKEKQSGCYCPLFSGQ